MPELSSQLTILGKRKAGRKVDNLVLRLTSPSSGSAVSLEHSESELSGPPSTSKVLPPIIINGCLLPNTKNRYRCIFEGCKKAYTKPSRLEEHERSHTGQRPFICDTCGKSYLRETHLHAHSRSHLPDSKRPFVCDRDGCEKRFWTSQHLQVHHSWHNGAKPYKCQEANCCEAFAKHHLLRAHVCAVHAPPGTKPYQCNHDGCTKSFNTNQHLRTHQKTHDSKRYTCIHPSCLAALGDSPTFFPTWSTLQSHIRKTHPPTCPQPSCNGKAFSNQGNLRAHLKLHEQRQIETDFRVVDESDSEADGPPKKRRRGGELGRDWNCDREDCNKEFKSKKALQTHVNVTHLGKRDFACHYGDCTRNFGYKHLLQRHVVKAHPSERSGVETSEDPLTEEEEVQEEAKYEYDIDTITGNAYAKHAEVMIKSTTTLRCPHPDLQGLVANGEEALAGTNALQGRCDYVFTRSYDLRRHLATSHEVMSTKEVVDAWVKWRKRSPL